MRTVAAVGSLVIDKWNVSTVQLNVEDIVATLLLHDLGNIVKFNFTNRSLWNGFTDQEIADWRIVRDEVAAKYCSTNDHEVTNSMAAELRPGARVLFLVSAMLMENAEAILDSSDFDLKLCAYADQRVAPWGIVTLKERFSDLAGRYTTLPRDYFVGRLELAERLESEVLANTSIGAGDINSESVNRCLESLGGLP